MKGIYKFTCKENNKSYIGQSINLQKRYEEHRRNHLNSNYCNYNSKFYRALRKYGFENFSYEILFQTDKNIDLDLIEVQFIENFDSYYNGYNSTQGGDFNPSLNPEIAVKRNEKIKNSPEILEKLSHKGENHPGTKLSNDDVYNIRECFKEGIHWDTVFKKYSHLIGESGFKAIWQGRTWKHIHYDVYSIKAKENRGGSKLISSDVIDIRNRFDSGESKKSILGTYKNKITIVGLNKIINRQTWKDI